MDDKWWQYFESLINSVSTLSHGRKLCQHAILRVGWRPAASGVFVFTVQICCPLLSGIIHLVTWYEVLALYSVIVEFDAVVVANCDPRDFSRGLAYVILFESSCAKSPKVREKSDNNDQSRIRVDVATCFRAGNPEMYQGVCRVQVQVR